jgi:hypothetical protein
MLGSGARQMFKGVVPLSTGDGPGFYETLDSAGADSAEQKPPEHGHNSPFRREWALILRVCASHEAQRSHIQRGGSWRAKQFAVRQKVMLHYVRLYSSEGCRRFG